LGGLFEGIPLSFGFFVFHFVISAKWQWLDEALGKFKDATLEDYEQGRSLLSTSEL